MKKAFQSKLIVLCVALIMLCTTAFAYTAGTYTDEGQGRNGAVSVTVEFDETRIVSIAVVEHSETAGISDAAISQIPQMIIENQSLNVDCVSGATMTSQAILDAVAGCVGQADGDVQALREKQIEVSVVEDTTEDAYADMVIVGAGGAGLAAAIQAYDEGVDAILIEKLSFVGGTTQLASTAYNAGGMQIQLAMDNPFTADDSYLRWLGSATEPNPYLRQQANLSGPTGDWLIEMGADLSRVNGAQVMTSDGSALGVMLIKCFEDNLAMRGIEARLSTEGKKLVTDETGKVIGIEVSSPSGDYTIYASAVLLTTGGFASNPEMVAQYTPQWEGYPSTASVGATGDGIRMAMELGAAISDMDNAGPQSVAYDTGNGAISLTNVRYNGAILVNQEGARFVNESGPSAPIANAIAEQTGGYAYLVFDQTSVDNAALMQQYKDSGYFVQANSINELAQTLGINAETLNSAIEKYRPAIDSGEDLEFGRNNHLVSRIDTAPFYGVRISPANQTTYGGVVIDLDTRVLREDNSVITGLYAAGETTAYRGSGTSIAIINGKLAAETIARDIEKADMKAAEIFVPGTYTVSATGNNGMVTFEVSFSADRIKVIEVVESSETEGIGDIALASISDGIIASQNTDVDGVSGATFSSRAIKTAVDEAIQLARSAK
ncbi:MAG: FAD-binding protein [Clostridia bacterium]|nr:FAD-binding protein [Clostridia bacterium]